MDDGGYWTPNRPQAVWQLKRIFCLLDMVNNWLHNLDTPSHYLRVCFLDFSKAFDRINHSILIQKLISMGVRSCLIPWICDFLSSRRQTVKINMVQSEWNYINGGVPQGTKLGPIRPRVKVIQYESLEIRWRYNNFCVPTQTWPINITVWSWRDPTVDWA